MTRVLRADDMPRGPAEGPFGHLDIRWMIGEHEGASLVMFGRSTYPAGRPGEKGATHETHYHPNAEEVVLVVEGRAEQIVGDDVLDMGPGDACFIAKGVPHRITAVSEDDLVIYWVIAGGASLEAAGYVPVPD